jgi:hypothetical protein
MIVPPGAAWFVHRPSPHPKRFFREQRGASIHGHGYSAERKEYSLQLKRQRSSHIRVVALFQPSFVTTLAAAFALWDAAGDKVPNSPDDCRFEFAPDSSSDSAGLRRRARSDAGDVGP